MFANNPRASLGINDSETALLLKILAELRVQTLLMSQAYGITDDISDLRNEVMTQSYQSLSDI